MPYSIVGKGCRNNNAFRTPKGVRKISPESYTDGMRECIAGKKQGNRQVDRQRLGKASVRKAVKNKVFRHIRQYQPAEVIQERNYSAHLRNNSEPLVPPNPKEFESAYSTFALRDWFGR